MELVDELENFFKSIEDGTVFDNISEEIWEIANRIVENNKEIADGI